MKTNNLAASISDQGTKQKTLVRAEMPKYYGFRKRPVIAVDKKGVKKMVSLKTADKKGMEIVNTMGITNNFK